MKDTLSTGRAVDLLMADEYAGWSREGASVLVDHLEELEEITGEEIEFDRVAIRCDYDEYASALKAALNYGFEPEKACPVCGEAFSLDDQENAVFTCDCLQTYPDLYQDWKEDVEASAVEFLEKSTIVIKFDVGIIIRAY